MKAVIYARYSSDNQREESTEGQIREYTAFVEKNGITILKHITSTGPTLQDRQPSGVPENDSGLQRKAVRYDSGLEVRPFLPEPL